MSLPADRPTVEEVQRQRKELCEELDKFISEYADVISSKHEDTNNSRQTLADELLVFVDDFDADYAKSEDWRKSNIPHANLLEDLGLDGKERVHVRFLSWLLKPNGSHEQGSLFLKAFLNLLSPSIVARSENLLDETKVVREDSLNDDGYSRRVDLCLSLAVCRGSS